VSARFRLETVERLRAARLGEAGADLQRAADALDAAVRHREALTAALNASSNPRRAAPDQLATAATHRDRLREERSAAAQEIDRCQEVLHGARVAWLEARAALKAVQCLHERHRELLAAQEVRREQRSQDEAAGILAGRRILSGRRILAGGGPA